MNKTLSLTQKKKKESFFGFLGSLLLLFPKENFQQARLGFKVSSLIALGFVSIEDSVNSNYSSLGCPSMRKLDSVS